MKRRTGISTLGVVTAILLVWVLMPGGAHGATITRLNLPATTFRGLEASPHNDGNGAEPDACPSQVPLLDGDEHYGDRNNSTGSFEEGVLIPDGAKVKAFSVFANDNDGDFDIHAYLIRKTITNGTTPKEAGYLVMAQADGNGAVNSVIRKFSAPSVAGATIDTSRYMYFVEMVICATTVEPFAVQVVYST